jgi:hypothetical protein
MQRHWLRFLMAIRGMGSPLDTYANWLEVAAKAMARARDELTAAQQYADRNGLYIQPDLTVRAYVTDRADAGAQFRTSARTESHLTGCRARSNQI